MLASESLALLPFAQAQCTEKPLLHNNPTPKLLFRTMNTVETTGLEGQQFGLDLARGFFLPGLFMWLWSFIGSTGVGCGLGPVSPAAQPMAPHMEAGFQDRASGSCKIC